MFTACGIKHRNYDPKHVELIEIVNKIIIVASSWLFVLAVVTAELETF